MLVTYFDNKYIQLSWQMARWKAWNVQLVAQFFEQAYCLPFSLIIVLQFLLYQLPNQLFIDMTFQTTHLRCTRRGSHSVGLTISGVGNRTRQLTFHTTYHCYNWYLHIVHQSHNTTSPAVSLSEIASLFLLFELCHFVILFLTVQ